jgi:predicted transcriptional regulator of viral defense system
MQPLQVLTNWLQQNASGDRYLFSLQDLRALCQNSSDLAFKTLLSRAASSRCLERICRGVYAYKKSIPLNGLALFHAAAQLRSGMFNYISLETALSDAGVISQAPMNWITIMSSGRSNTVSCGKYGSIEFVHTEQKPSAIMNQLTYDANCRLWRADIKLALRDMKRAHRNCDLIDWDAANELI